MFRFEHIDYLWMLTALVPFTLLFVFYRHWVKKSLTKLGKPEMIKELSPDRSSGKVWAKFLLLQLAFVFIVLGFANPQVGTRQEKIKRQGIDVVIAMDVSNSMMSEDVKPSRLARAKNFVSHFIGELRNDRFGMIVFAGKAYLQMPLTVDYSAGRMYLKTISPRLVPTQGTNIAEAIDLARKSFVKEDTKHKALIIITDGEDNEGGTDEAIEAAISEGVKIFTIGVGTDNGGPIPVGSDYKREEDGSIVLSKMNPTMLREIANKGQGKYMQLGSGKDEVQIIMKELGRMGTKDFEEYVFTDFDDQYQWCLAIAALLLLLEWILSERKFNGLKRWA